MFNIVMSNLFGNLSPVIITFGVESGVFLKEENAKCTQHGHILSESIIN